MSNNFKSDPKNYHEMSKPYKDKDEANDSWAKFYSEVSDLRKKYKVTDLLVVSSSYVTYEDGEVGQIMIHMGYGDMSKQTHLAAYAYGRTQAEEKERLNKILNDK